MCPEYTQTDRRTESDAYAHHAVCTGGLKKTCLVTSQELPNAYPLAGGMTERHRLLCSGVLPFVGIVLIEHLWCWNQTIRQYIVFFMVVIFFSISLLCEVPVIGYIQSRPVHTAFCSTVHALKMATLIWATGSFNFFKLLKEVYASYSRQHLTTIYTCTIWTFQNKSRKYFKINIRISHLLLFILLPALIQNRFWTLNQRLDDSRVLTILPRIHQ